MVRLSHINRTLCFSRKCLRIYSLYFPWRHSDALKQICMYKEEMVLVEREAKCDQLTMAGHKTECICPCNWESIPVTENQLMQLIVNVTECQPMSLGASPCKQVAGVSDNKELEGLCGWRAIKCSHHYLWRSHSYKAHLHWSMIRNKNALQLSVFIGHTYTALLHDL